jgi:Recombination endonuclease VII
VWYNIFMKTTTNHTLTCSQCSRSFLRRRGQKLFGDSNAKTFCSSACHSYFYGHRGAQDIGLVLTCSQCSVSFPEKMGQRHYRNSTSSTFCSASCSKTFHKSKRVKSVTRPWVHSLSGVDPVEKTATCAKCGLVNVNRKRKGWTCSVKSKEENKASWQRHRTSRPLKDKCEVCSSTTKLCWDHDHSTGIHRGTLCNSCNASIGFAGDNPTRLRALANYLEGTKA